jgi:hypothetical protein
MDQPEPVAAKLQALIDSGATRPFAFLIELDEAWEKVGIYGRRSV